MCIRDSDKVDMPAVVKTLEYDPNRSAHIALVQYEDGEKRYIIAPEGLKVGDTVMSGAGADIKPGNCLPFANIPVSYTHLDVYKRQVLYRDARGLYWRNKDARSSVVRRGPCRARTACGRLSCPGGHAS